MVAYSGGLDSTFLLKAACDCLGDKVLAVTADSATYPREELIFAKKIARSLGVKHIIIKTDEIKNEKFIKNPVDRCYYCKRELFLKLNKLAKQFKLKFVVDASNASDKFDFRPGLRARHELGVRSPLEEAGITKEKIRALSKKLGLSTWDKPSLACLASRIPYGTKIEQKILKRISDSESYLRKLGFKQVRVRHYNALCRIEVMKEDIPVLITKRNQIVEKLNNLGYNYITVDLKGYRTGSLNEVIK